MQRQRSSFRDSSGFVFEYQSSLYRSVLKSYELDFQHLNESGLYEALNSQALLVKHSEVKIPALTIPNLHCVLKPDQLPLISYPYEWCFSQLKAAAMLTLNIQKISLDHGMILKDASAYNVQFKGTSPIFMDTLSFEIYSEGQIWQAYKQFCEHFLAPLCIASYLGAPFLSLSRLGINGVPLEIASKILPARTWMTPGVLMHIHLHAKTANRFERKEKPDGIKSPKISKKDLYALVDHLYRFVGNFHLSKSDKTQWQDYDKETHYSKAGKQLKANLLAEFFELAKPKVVWDVGANDGYFSRSVAGLCDQVVSLDFDSLAIEKNYVQTLQSNLKNVYPLLFDLVNPSPGMGWANEERSPLFDRSKPNLVMALALIHHIVITHNIPFENIAHFFAGITEWLVIEFIPQDDDKIKPLPETAGKERYSRHNFEVAFFEYFTCVLERKISDSERSILLLKRNR